MSCVEYTCRSCGEFWFDSAIKSCPKCKAGENQVVRFFDEDHYTEVDCDLKDYYDDEAEVN